LSKLYNGLGPFYNYDLKKKLFRVLVQDESYLETYFGTFYPLFLDNSSVVILLVSSFKSYSHSFIKISIYVIGLLICLPFKQ